MVYRSLNFFTNARQRRNTNNVVVYLAAEAKFFGSLKCKHKTIAIDFYTKTLDGPVNPLTCN